MSSHVKTWHHWTIVVWRWKDHQWFQQNGITPCTANITLEWLDYHSLQRLSVNAKIIRVPTFAWPESHRLLLTGMFEGSCIWEQSQDNDWTETSKSEILTERWAYGTYIAMHCGSSNDHCRFFKIVIFHNSYILKLL